MLSATLPPVSIHYELFLLNLVAYKATRILALSKALGCDFDKKEKDDTSLVVDSKANPRMNRPLPRVMVDGPFGSASEDFLKVGLAPNISHI